MMTAASLFAGIGGFDLALERNDVSVTAAVEIDTAARGVIADHLPHVALHHDVTEIAGDDLRADGFVPERGILTGGFPCQDLSMAGHREGLRGARSGLFWEIDRLMAELHPAWVILENVPGLLSSHGGRDMGAVLGSLGQRGYGWAYRVLDAQHFGVPQRRRRVFIVGRLGDRAAPVQILLEPESGGRHPTPPTAATPSANAAADAGGSIGIPRVATSLKARDYKQSPDSDATQTLVTTGTAVRRLTPLECERLQGFPDGWTATSHGKPQSDSARYRQLGNAVAVPVVEWIVHRVLAISAATDGSTRVAS